MKGIVVQEDSARVLATAVALWGGSVTLAAWEGVFAKLSPATYALLVAFAIGFAAASYGLDRGLKALASQTGVATLWGLTLAADGILIVTAFAAPGLESLARFPYALPTLFIAPLAAALHIASAQRLRGHLAGSGSRLQLRVPALQVRAGDSR